MSLEARKAAVTRKGHTILSEVDFRLAPGEIMAVAGPNGVGKTTLARAVLRLLPLAAGDILLEGRSLRAFSRAELARWIAYAPQAAPGFFPMTVYEMVLLGRRPHISWRPRRIDQERAVQAMELLRIADLAERDVGALSGGQFQKAVIARAVAQETPYLLLDEPTASLDLRCQAEVMGLLRSLAAERGVGILAILHDVNLATLYADKALLLREGRVHSFGDPSVVFTTASLREVYGAEMAFVEGGGVSGFLPAAAQ